MVMENMDCLALTGSWSVIYNRKVAVRGLVVFTSVYRSKAISHKTRDPKTTGRRQLLIVSPVIPGVTAIHFYNYKMTSTHLKN